MPTYSSSHSAEIIAEPERVWAVLSDVTRWPRVLTSMTALEPGDGSGVEQGATWREKRRVASINIDLGMTVIESIPAQRLVLQAVTDGATLTLTYMIRPTSLGTRLELTGAVEQAKGGFGSRISGAVGGGAARVFKEMLEQDVDDFAAAAR